MRKGWKWSSPAPTGRKRERTARPKGIRPKFYNPFPTELKLV